jgi:hypothetical protein
MKNSKKTTRFVALSVCLIAGLVAAAGAFAQEKGKPLSGLFLEAGIGYGNTSYENAMATYTMEAGAAMTFRANNFESNGIAFDLGLGYDFGAMSVKVLDRFGAKIVFGMNSGESDANFLPRGMTKSSAPSYEGLWEYATGSDTALEFDSDINFGLELFGKVYSSDKVDVLIPLGFQYRGVKYNCDPQADSDGNKYFTGTLEIGHADLYTGLGVDVKLNKHLKLSAAYTFGGAVGNPSVKFSTIFEDPDTKDWIFDEDPSAKVLFSKFTVGVKANL